MRGRAAMLWALLALLGWAPVAWAGGGGENMLLIVNPEDENAVRIAQEYQRLRGIPDSNIIFITPPKGFGNMFTAVPTEAQWKSTYVDTILNTIQARGLNNQIDYISELGQPYAFSGGPYGRQSAGYALANLRQWATGYTSTNLNLVSLPLYDVNSYSLGANDAIHSSRVYTNWSVSGATVTNAQFFMGGQLGWSGFGGNSAAQIISNLNYTFSGDGMKPVGTVYLETNSDIRTTTRMSQFPGVTNQLATRGITGIIEAGNTPVNRTNVLGTTVGYAGMVLPNGSTYLPGSWGDNLTSNGSQFDTLAQTKSTMFIASGAAGTSGTVTEPYAIAARFPNAMIHVFNADGSTLGEAFYKSSQSPDLLLFTGDMLAQPFADIPTVMFTSGPSEGGSVNGSISLGARANVTPSATTTGIKQIELYVDGKLFSTITDSNGTFNLDTTTLSDGRHQFRVVGVNNSQAESEGYTLRNLFVSNHGRSMDTPTNLWLQAGETVSVSVNSVAGDGTVDHVELRQMGRTIGQVSGGSGSINLAATSIAYGTNAVVPVAVFTDGTEVAGTAFNVARQPNYLAGARVTSLDDRGGGLLGQYFLGKGSNSIANSDFSGLADITRLQSNSAFAAPTGLTGFTNYGSPPAYNFLATANITNLAYKMTGKFAVNTTGEYAFFFYISQDSVLVKVDGEAVIGFDNTSSGYTTMWGSNIFLSAGQHDLELFAANRETGSRNGYFDVALFYRGPDGIMRIFDQNSIYQPFYSTAPIALWTGLGDGLNWSDPANWLANALPNQNEMAVLDSVAEGTSRAVTFDAVPNPSNLMDSIRIFQDASANATNTLLVQGNLVVTNTIWLIASNGFTHFDTRGALPSTTTVGKLRAVTFDSGRAGVTLDTLATINAARFSLSNSFLTNFGVANFTSVYLEGGAVFDHRPGATLNAAGFTNVGGTFRIGGGLVNITNTLFNAGGFQQLTAGTNLNRLVINTDGAIWQSGGEMRALTVTNAAQWTLSGGLAVLTNCNVIAGGALNLLGGTLVANQVNAPSPGGVVNFNGGLLTVGPGSTMGTNFMPANLIGYIWAGGATIDSGTGLVTVAASLLVPTGYGLSSVAVTDGGSGYKGVPLVQISGGSGTGATAIALVDPVAGTVTNIFITNPGVGYLAADVLSVSLISGGYISEATLGTVGLITNNASGGLTKLGSGILTLAGSNTYAGGTFLNAGELNITNSWNIGGPGSALTFNGGLLQIGSNYPVTLLDNHVVNWSSFTGGFDVLGGFAFVLTNAITGGGSFTKLGSGALTLTATNSYSGPTIVGGSGVFAFNTLSNLGGAVAAIIITNGAPTIAPTFVPASTFVGNTVIQPTTNVFIFALPASTSTNYSMAAYAKGFLGTTNGAVVNYTGVLVSPTNAVNLGGGGTLAFNSQQIGGARNFVGADTNLFIGAPGGIPGTVITTNNHFYLGGTFITASNTLQVGDGGSSGSLGAGNIANNGTLVANRGDIYLLTNSMSGTGVLVQNGSGTLVLANKVFGNSGGLIANAGTTIISNSFVRGGLTLSNSSTVVIVGGSNEGLMGDYYQSGSTTQSPLSNAFTTLANQTPVLAFNSSPTTNTFDFNTGGSGVGFPPPYNIGGSLAVNFQARWQGIFNAPTNGLYTFVNNSDDNTVIFVDGNQVLSAAGSVDQPGSITLTAGAHSIVIFYQQGSGGYTLRESIVLPGGSQVRLANSMMSPAFTIGSLAGDAGTTLALSNHVSIVQTNDATFAGTIIGTGAVIKNGNSTLQLTGTNTYTGGTFLQMGRLAIAEDSNIGGSTAALTFAGGILQVTGTTLTNLDTHPVNWSSFNGGFDISNAANVFTVTNAIGGANIAKFGPGTLVLNGGLSNTNGVTLNTGVLELNASNSYTGGTLINGGYLQVGNPFALGNPTNALSMSFTNATLDLNGNNITIGSLSGGPFALISDGNAVAGTTTLTISNAVPIATTFGGSIQDGTTRDMALTVVGPVRLTLTNLNYISGSLQINAGQLSASGGVLILGGIRGALPSTTNIFLSDGAALILTNTSSLYYSDRLSYWAVVHMSGSTFQYVNDGGNGSFVESFRTLALDGGANTLVSRQASNTGTNALYLYGGIVRSPGAVLDIIGAGIGTGMNNRVYINPSPALVNGMLPWATVNQTNFATYNTGFGSLSNYTAYRTTAWGDWDSTNNVRLNAGFSATSNTTINSLNLHLISANAVADLGGNTLTLNSGGLLFGGTNLVNGQFIGTGYGSVLTNGVITAGNGSSATELFYFVSQPVVTNSVTITDNGPVGGVSLVKAGSGTLLLDLASTNNYSGGTFLAAGTLYIQTDANLGAAGSNVIINAATLQTTNNIDFGARQVWTRAASATISVDPGSTLTATSLIYGTGGLIKSGLGTLVLGENNTYSGGTMISNGTLAIGYDTALGAAGSLLALSGGALQVTNTMTVDSRSVLLGGPGGVFNVDPTMMLTVSSVISGTGGLIKAGAGTLVLSNANIYGGVLISNLVQGTRIAGGTVVLGVDGALSTGVVVMAGGQLVAGGSSLVTNYVNLAVKSVFDTTPGNLKLTGPIYSTNASGLVKVGAGTLTLGGYNTYAGGTIVSNGTLVLTNALLTSALIVTNGASVVVSSAGAVQGLTGDYYFHNSNVVTSPALNTYDAFNSYLASTSVTTALIFPGNTLGNTNFEFGGSFGSAANPVQYFPLPFNNGATKSIVRWQGMLTAPTNGVYTFNLPSDDGARLYLDGVLIASQNGSGTTNLVAGPHHILIAYDNGGGGSENIYINIAFPMGTYSNRLPNAMLTSAGVVGSLAGDAASTVTIADGTLMVVQTNNAEFAGTITGDGRLAKSGSGLLTLSGANTHTGGTFLAAGTLGISSDANFGAAGAPLTFAGGILQITGTTLTNLDLGRPINWNWFNGGFDIADGNNLFTLTNTISGVSPIVKNGVGTLVLSGSNNFSGGFSINAGTVRVDNAFAMGLPGRLDMNGGVLDLNGNNGYISGLTGVGRITDNNGVVGVTTLNLTNIFVSSVFGGQITDGANGRQMALTVGGSGTMIFTNASSYTGPTVLLGATLSLSNLAGALSGSTSIVINPWTMLQLFNTATSNNNNRLNDAATIVMQGGTLVFTNNGSGGVAFSESVGNLVLAAGNSTIITGATNLSGGTSSTLSFNNFVRGTGATINFTGPGLGTSVLNRIVFNPTPIVSGLMTNSLIAPWAIVNGLGTNADWATYDANLNTVSNYSGYALNTVESAWDATANLRLTASATLTGDRSVYTMKIGGSGTTTYNLGGYTLTVNGGGIIAAGGATALISGGNLTAGAPGVGGELHYFQFNSGAAPTNQILANIVDNAGGPVTFVKNGPYALSLIYGTNTYSGGTIVNQGLLMVGYNGNMTTNAGGYVSGLGSGALTIQQGGMVQFAPGSSSVYYFTNAIVLNGGAIANGAGGGGAIFHLTGPVALNQPLVFSSTATNSTIMPYGYAGQDIFLDNVVSGSGGLRIAGGGNVGAVFLTTNNTYSGGTWVNGGYLFLGSTTNLGTTPTVTNTLGTGPLMATAVGAAYAMDQGFLDFINARASSPTGVVNLMFTGNGVATTVTNALNFAVEPNLAASYLSIMPWRGNVTYNGSLTPALNTYRFNGQGGSAVLIIGSLLTNASDGTRNNLLIGPNGTVVLTNNNIYSGWTYVTNGGTLQLGTNTATGSLGLGVVTNYGTIVFTLTNSVAYAFTNTANFFGSGGIVKYNSNLLQMAVANTGYTGAITVNAGTLQAGTNFAFGNGAGVMTLNNVSLLDLNGCTEWVGGLAGIGTVSDTSLSGGCNMLFISNSTAQTFSGSVVDGPATRLSVIKLGSGLQSFAGTNSYTGGTIIGGYGLSGPLRAVFGLGLPYAGNLTISNGSFETSFYFTNALGVGNGQVQLPYYTNSLNPGNLAAAGFSAFGTNMVINLGNNGGTLMWGSTYFNPGYLLLGDTTANATLVLSNGLDLAGVQRNIYANGPNNFVVLAGGVTNSGTGVANLVKYGQGMLVLTGTNIFYGTFNLQSGGLYINGDANLGSTGLTLTLGANANQSPVTLRVTNNVTFNNRPVVINTNVAFLIDSASRLTITNIVSSGGGVTLTKNGLGTLLFTTNANTYGLRTVIAQGALVVGTTNALGTTNNLAVGSGRIDLSNPAGAIGTTNALDQSFINWVAVRSWTNFGGSTNVQGAIALAANSANPLNFLAPNATNNWTNIAANLPLTNAFLGAADGTWTYSGTLSPWTNSGLGIRLFGNAVGPNSGTNVFLLGGGNGVLDFATVIGPGTNVVIGPEGFTGGGVVQFTNYNLMNGRIAVVGGTLRAQTNIGLASTVNLMLSNGVFEVMGGGWLTSTLSRAAGGLWLATNSFAGFSTFGGPLILDLNGGNGSLLTWGNSNFSPAMLVLGTNTTAGLITVSNAIDINTSGARTTLVAGTVVLANMLTNSQGGGNGGSIEQYGNGTLIYSNVTQIPVIRAHGGTMVLATNATMNLGWGGTVGGLIVGSAAGEYSVVRLNNGSRLVASNSGVVIGDSGIGQMFIGPDTNTFVSASILSVGRTVGGLGAVWQTGGTVSQVNTGNTWFVGQAGYGYYNLSGGTLATGGTNWRFQIGVSGTSFGQFDMSGGNFYATGRHLSVNGKGVFNLSGGTFTQGIAGIGNLLIIGDFGSELAQFNMSGGQATLLGGLRATWNNGNTGVVNLLGGTLSTTSLDAKLAGTNAYAQFNFNGGTLQALANNTNWFGGAGQQGGFNAVYVRENGATFDVQGFNVTLQAGLIAPTGMGVGPISVAYGGQGYITPPQVQLIGGGGSNATAYAQIDPVTGSVTNIVVANPGDGYTSAPYALLIGGVLTNTFNGFAAVAGVPTLATNASGGLVKLGAGALMLTRSNTYAGTTIVSNGLLAINGYYTGGGSLIVSGAATNVISLNAGTGLFNNVTLAGNAVLTNSAGSQLALTGNFDNGSTNFALNSFAGMFRFQGGIAKTQQVEVASAYAAPMSATNFLFGTFQIGDPLSGSNAIVQLVDNRNNTVGGGNELFAASNLIVALSGSILDWNNRSGFTYNLSNAGTMQWTNAGNPAGTVIRMDVVNTFTNLGTISIGNNTVLQFSNAFLNGANWGILALFNGGVLTNFAAGNVLTNAGTIHGDGVVSPAIANTASGSVIATGGVLRLTGGLTNSVGAAVNAGLLAVLGVSAQLNVEQAFTNFGTIQLNNSAATFTAPRVDNAGQILGNGVFNAVLNNAVTGVVSNDGTGGTLTFNSAVSNAGNMVALNDSSLAFVQAVNNVAGGLIAADNGGTVTFSAAVTNAAGGTLAIRNQSTLIFNAGLTNNGTIKFDAALNPSTAIITGTLLLGSSGIITMTHTNDVLVMRGNFVNGSTDTNNFNMRHGTMVFGGTSPTLTNTFEVASTNKGYYFSGFQNNMALGTLNITNHIEFVNQINNGGGLGTNECLYVDVLHLFNGATLKLSQLTVYVGVEFIYEDGNGTKVLTGSQGQAITEANKDSYGLANVFLDNGGQIVFVPEPTTGLLTGLGLATLVAWRRRRTSW
ncbi:MAG: autotransporter-associated beta strand repeat-containing protein [Verrucomicrobia bacterium]|nr:autotransporter-associated beta strand repeat-containing protein [Verrucomicrobiota bacterium]